MRNSNPYSFIRPFIQHLLIKYLSLTREQAQRYKCVCLVTQPCPTLWDPWTVAHQAPLSMGFSGKNTGVCCHLLQIQNKMRSSAFSMESTQQCYGVVRTHTLQTRTERFRKLKSLTEKSPVRGLALVVCLSNSKLRVILHYSVCLIVLGVWIPFCGYWDIWLYEGTPWMN